MTRLFLDPIGDSYLLVVAVALVLLVLLVLSAGRKGTSRSRRVALVALRAAVIALVILAMLRPTLVYLEMKRQSATLVILADRSRSMTVPDTVGEKSRWRALRDAMADAQDALAELAEDFELKAYTFADDVQETEVEDGWVVLPEVPDGQETAIGAALEKVLTLEAGKRLLGVILLSDGAQRAYAPRDVEPQSAAARMKRLGYPLFTVPFGQSLGLGQAQDVAVTELLVNRTVFEKNELSVVGQVRVDGFVNVDVPVRVLFEQPSGEMKEVARETVTPTAADAGRPHQIKLGFAPQQSGEYKLTLEALEQKGELVRTNNRMSTFVKVLAGGLNVLYVEGTFRVEQKFLRRSLDASPDISVDYVRIDPRQPEIRPGDLAERFEPGKYDVYVFGDVDSRAFQTIASISGAKDPGPADFPMLARLVEAVDRGAGLIMLGGFQSFGPGGYAATPLAPVLPVVMDKYERQILDRPIRSDVHLPGPLYMRPNRFGLRHFVLELAGSQAENEALWAKLPPLEGANKFSPSNVASGSLVLADAGRNVPLLISGAYGGGRVLAFAGDSTWRWWLRGHESAHKRFWRQVILWLAKKNESSDGNVWIRLARRRFAPGERVEVTVGARSATGEPIAGAVYQAEVVLPEKSQRRPVDLARQEDRMVGSFTQTQKPGDYVIEVTATHEKLPGGSAKATARFLVFQQDLELDNAAADATLLESLAAMTSYPAENGTGQTGGESLAPEQLTELIQRLARQTEDLQVEQEATITFWDSWWLFLAMVALLGVEWYLRKRWGMV